MSSSSCFLRVSYRSIGRRRWFLSSSSSSASLVGQYVTDDRMTYRSKATTTACRMTTTPHNGPRNRWLSTSSTAVSAERRLKVAIVGGGCAGLSTALHLAPLVEQGLIASPIDVFDATPPLVPNSTQLNSSSTSAGRDIGVGIWSTALEPFRWSDRISHATVWSDLTQLYGSWVGDAGYRTPSGAWLMKSHLPNSTAELDSPNNRVPALLFVREKDFLTTLRKAVHWEQQRGMIHVHRDGSNTRVTGLYEQSSQPWSTQLIFEGGLRYSNDKHASARDYHLIIVADGTRSILRQDYGGHETERWDLPVVPSQIGLPVAPGGGIHSHVSSGSSSSHYVPTMQEASWDEDHRQEGVGLQDRHYTVFRGNAPLTMEQMGVEGTSFQTWGTGHSMRFATVPMSFPGGGGQKNREERQVWFITIDDDQIAMEPNATKRKEMLLDRFKDWHEPIGKTVQATPAEDILMERAIAHRYCMGPVIAFNKVVQQITGIRPPNSGEGPCLVFMGDAYMTIDPILAQGFTVAMEGAFALRNCVEHACQRSKDPTSANHTSILEFDPYLLRKELKRRHDGRMDRLICLLRVTELVQALGQPVGGTLTGYFHTKLLRPLMQLTPNAVKAPVFDAVLKYSLGLSPFARSGSVKPEDIK